MYRIKRRSAEPNADQASRAAKACKSDGTTTTTTSAPAPAAAAAQQEAAAPKPKPPNQVKTGRALWDPGARTHSVTSVRLRERQKEKAVE